MSFAQWVLRIAGIYGLLVMPPLYFLEQRIGQDEPPAITHPEFFYGFAGVGIAWQVAFLIMSRDPVRFRPLMIAGILEKLGYGIAVTVLFFANRVSSTTLCFGCMDYLAAGFFLAAYLKTPEPLKTA